MKTKSKINKPDFPLAGTIARLAELGLDEGEIAYSLGIGRLKLEEFKKQKGAADAFKSGLEARARKVENALFSRAVGFEYEELVTSEKPALTTPRSGKSELPPFKERTSKSSGKGANKTKLSSAAVKETGSSKSTVKTVIPDVTACIFWLKNRLPDKWRDPKDIENGKLSFSDYAKMFEHEDSKESADKALPNKPA